MNDKTRKLIITCPHCKNKLNDWFRGNYKGRYINTKSNITSYRYFCTKECYENYKKQFLVETYKNNSIYCVEINGGKRYMPYFESSYYFKDIDSCKQRMDMKNVAVTVIGLCEV